MTEATVHEALVRLSRAVGSRYGLVRAVELAELEAGDPPVAVAFSHPGGVAGGATGTLNEGGGASLDPKVAMIKAIAESIERYCASASRRRSVRCTWRGLDEPAVRPEDFALFSEQQHAEQDFPFARFDADTAVTWEPGRLLLDGSPMLVPTAFVSLPYRRPRREPRITTAISTGLAAALSPEAALLSALLEVVERDAFMLVWRHRRVPPGIDLDRLPHGHARRLVAELRSTGMTCNAVLLTQELEIPVVGIVLRGAAPHHPKVVVGAGASPWPSRAVVLALEEVCLSLFGMNRLMRSEGTDPAGDVQTAPRSLTAQSLAFAMHPEVAARAAFLAAAPPTLELGALEERFASMADGTLRSVVTALGEYMSLAVGIDVTTPEVRDMGVHVARVVVPGLRPLDHDAAMPNLGGRRWLDGPRDPGSHPFP